GALPALAHMPERGDGEGLVRSAWRRPAARRTPEIGRDLPGGLMPVTESSGERHRPVRRSGNDHSGRQVATGDEGGDVVAPDRPAPHVAGEMDVRRPAARDGEAVGIDPGTIVEGDALQPLAPCRVDDAPAAL